MSTLITDIDKQVQRAMGLLRDGDRSPYFLRGAGTFIGGQTGPVQIALSVPADGDFYGDAFSLYIEARTIVTATGVAEKAFRSVDWTSTNDVSDTADFITVDSLGRVSGTFDLKLPESYANQATNSGALFSARHGYRSGFDASTAPRSFSVFPSKLEFFTPVFVPRGQTVVAVFTPGYARAPTPPNNSTPATTMTEYRVSAIMEGYKKVKSLVGVTE